MSSRVLIIDDEVEIRRNLTVGLTQEGYTCTACPDGISAVHELNKSRETGKGYDYLVTDIFMPDIDGLKILKVIKSEFPDLPVLVITGFGNEVLEATALAEYNTGFLDKPFEIPDLVAALKQLTPGPSTADAGPAEAPTGEIRESLSTYLTIRIADTGRDIEIYKELYFMDGVASCDAVRGDVDIILLLQAGSQADMDALLARIRGIAGIGIVSLSPVERPRLDTDVASFIEIYKRGAKAAAQAGPPRFTGTRSYVIVDIDREAIQQVFTTLFFLDEVIFCDVIDDGSRLIGIVTEGGAFGKAPRIIEKLGQIDGVLRVKEASIIKLIDF